VALISVVADCDDIFFVASFIAVKQFCQVRCWRDGNGNRRRYTAGRLTFDVYELYIRQITVRSYSAEMEWAI